MIEEEGKGRSIYRIIMLVIVTAILSSFGTVVYIKKYGMKNVYKPIEVKPAEEIADLPDYISEVDKAIRANYMGEIKNEDLINGAIKGYVDGLNDPYTEYFTKNEMDEFKTSTAGEYVGVGVYIGASKKTNQIVVIAPIKGSPAAEAGIKSGDIITKLDGNEYSGDEINQASTYMKGKEGTKVNIEIIRDDEVMNFDVERRKIDIAPVEVKVLDGNIGYIALPSFDEKCSDEIKSAIVELKSKNVNGIIFDLRDNGGGLVDQALDILDFFIQKGENLLITVDRNNRERTNKAKNDVLTDMKLVVLTNEGSASASEIVAGTLKDLGRAKIVGETTYGKGVIQTLLPLSDGAGLKVTIEEYFTAGKNKIDGVGIIPDVEVKNDKNTEKDEQLEKALEIIKQ